MMWQIIREQGFTAMFAYIAEIQIHNKRDYFSGIISGPFRQYGLFSPSTCSPNVSIMGNKEWTNSHTYLMNDGRISNFMFFHFDH